MKVKLQLTKLLGFRILVAAGQSVTSAKIGEKIGGKPGFKVGMKPNM
ncbi:hypothetical protein [Parvibaculum sp.]